MENARRNITMYCALRADLALRNGDEAFYAYFGDNEYDSFSKSIHVEDRTRFEEDIANLQEDESIREVFRLKDGNGDYQWQLVNIVKHVTASKSYDIYFSDIMEMEQEQRIQESKAIRYGSLLGIFEYLFFEYSIDTEIIQIYSLQNKQELIIYKENLSTWCEKCLCEGYVAEGDLETFKAFCKDVEQGVSRFCYDISHSIITKGRQEERSRFIGTLIYEDFKPVMVMGVISALEQQRQKIHTQEYVSDRIDSLTGLANKKEVAMLAKRKIMEKPNHSVIYAVIDIDDFKMVNDTYGHMFGDQVISGVANVLRSVVGERGVCGRFGGDEFFVVLENIDEEEIRRIFRTIRMDCQYLFEESVSALKLTLSIGIAGYPVDGHTYESVFLKADRALYIAKEKGKNRYIIYDPKKHGEVEVNKRNETAMELSAGKKGAKRTRAMCRIYEALSSEGLKAFSDINESMGDVFTLNRIRVLNEKGDALFYWDDLKKDEIREFHWKDKAYLQGFDENGIFACNYIMYVAGKAPEVYQELKEQQVYSMFQFIIYQGEEPMYLISYETCYARRLWSEGDIHNLSLVSTFFAEAIRNNL